MKDHIVGRLTMCIHVVFVTTAATMRLHLLSGQSSNFAQFSVLYSASFGRFQVCFNKVQ